MDPTTDTSAEAPQGASDEPEGAIPGQPVPSLDPRQARALAALLVSATIDQAAAKADVSRRTLSRWLAEDNAFREALARETRALVTCATTRIRTITSEALECLERNLRPPVPPSVQVRAAGVILEHWRSCSLVELEQRLAALEVAASERRAQ